MAQLITTNKTKSELYSNESIYFPIKEPVDLAKFYLEGIGHILSVKEFKLPYVFHAMTSYPEGDFLIANHFRKDDATPGHENLVFSYTTPRNNVRNNNNLYNAERIEMNEIIGEEVFYNLILSTKHGIQRFIRLGSSMSDGYLCIIDGSGFKEILKPFCDDNLHQYYVHQTVKPNIAKIVDVIKITSEESFRVYGFKHIKEFEFFMNFFGGIPIDFFLENCSTRMHHKLCEVANEVYSEDPLPVPKSLEEYVLANRMKSIEIK